MNDSTLELYPCLCSCSALALDVWEDEDDQAYISLWQHGSQDTSLRARLRHAWHCLRHGHPYTDDVILTRETAIRLGADLLGDGWYPVAVVQHVCRDTWADKPLWYWSMRLGEECSEFVRSLDGEHLHPPEWEATQIASLCVNWLRHHGREGWMLECVELLDKKGK